MKKSVFFFAFLCFYAYDFYAQTAPTVYHEVVSHDGMVGTADLTGQSTYRVFASLGESTDFLTAVLGYNENPIHVSTSTSFYQSDFGGTEGDEIALDLLPFFPEIEFDSYVTVGAVGDSHVGISYSEDDSGLIEIDAESNSVLTIQDSDATWIDVFESGGSIEINTFVGGAWFTLPTGLRGYGVGVDNAVFLGQFTTDGLFEYCLNVQVIHGDDTSIEYGGNCGAGASCGDSEACNYDPEADPSESNCTYDGDPCNDGNSDTLSDTLDENCDCVGLTVGCMDSSACNYNEEAEMDNGSCLYPGDSCDDGNELTGNDTLNDSCECFGEDFGISAPVVFHETINHDGMIGTVDFTGLSTYRIFASLSSPLDFLSSVYGDMDNPLFVTTSSTFYHTGLGVSDGDDVIPPFYELIPEMEFESFVTVGAVGTNHVGIPYSEDPSGLVDADPETNSIFIVEDPNSPWAASFANGDNIVIDTFTGGAWFTLPTGTRGFGVGVDNVVMLGQFTTSGTFEYCLNVQVLHGAIDDLDMLYNNLCGQGESCGDVTACNYDDNADPSESNCTYPGDSCDDGDSSTAADTINENCDCEGSIEGCTNEDALNYEEEASVDDGSCILEPCDDEPLQFDYCYTNNETSVWVFEENTPGAGVVIQFVSGFLESGWDGMSVLDADGNVVGFGNGVEGDLSGLIYATDTESITVTLSSDGSVSCSSGDIAPMTILYYCSTLNLEGCTDSNACNFNPDANSDNGLCEYPGDICDDLNWNTIDDVIQEDCSCSGDLLGCIDVDACNFNPNADLDDGTCFYIGDSCDDNNDVTELDEIQEDCTCSVYV